MTISIRIESSAAVEVLTKLECEVQEQMAEETRNIKAGMQDAAMNNEMARQAETKYLKRISEIDQKIRACRMVESVLVSSDDEIINLLDSD